MRKVPTIVRHELHAALFLDGADAYPLAEFVGKSPAAAFSLRFSLRSLDAILLELSEYGASDLFRRLNSYSKQHALNRALKAFGQIPKSLIILQVIDDPVLRQAIEKQMDRIEHVHRFTRAISVGNPRGFLQAEKEDQEMAEACMRLIKDCIICWNYLYPSQRFEEITDTESREALLDAVAHDSTVAWRHLNLLGEYDFSAEKCGTASGSGSQLKG
jgi:hypothetical protein